LAIVPAQTVGSETALVVDGSGFTVIGSVYDTDEVPVSVTFTEPAPAIVHAYTGGIIEHNVTE
jgi:hypothetical protein